MKYRPLFCFLIQWILHLLTITPTIVLTALGYEFIDNFFLVSAMPGMKKKNIRKCCLSHVNAYVKDIVGCLNKINIMQSTTRSLGYNTRYTELCVQYEKLL